MCLSRADYPPRGAGVWHNFNMADANEKAGGNAEAEQELKKNPTSEEQRPKEIGGRKGPDPTRYGDWEKNGRCIDF